MLIDNAKGSCTDDDNCNTAQNVDNKCDNNKCICKGNTFGNNCEFDCDKNCNSNHMKCFIGGAARLDSTTCDCESDYVREDINDISAGCRLRNICFDPNFCENGGTCTQQGRTEVCKCLPGYFGPQCKTKCEEFCDPNKSLECVKNESAPEASNAVKCKCKKDFKLANESDVDEIREKGCIKDLCINNTCAEGSVCDDSDRTVKCNCPANVFGELCDIKCDKVCDPNKKLTCLNESTTPNGYKCVCAENHIEINKTENIVDSGCRINYCKTEGGCINGTCDDGEGRCKCSPNFFGFRCEIPCDKLCLSSANFTCVPDTNQKYNESLVKCACKDANFIFHDENNEKKGCFEDLCQQADTCSTNGKCVIKEGQAICKCESGFFGTKCEKSCLQDKCNGKHNTTCSEPIPPTNEVACLCLKEFRPISKNPETDGCIQDLCGKNPNWCNFGECKDDNHKRECVCNEDNCTDICKGHDKNTECGADPLCKCKKGYKPIGSSAEKAGCREDPCKPESCVKGTCDDVDESPQCTCPDAYFGKTCSDECTKVCSGSNLQCLRDVNKPYAENAAICLCNDNYIPKNKDKIEDGCKLDSCINNQCNTKGTETCLIVNDTEHRCKCKPNYFGINCENICGQVCNKPNLICKLKDESNINNDYKCECKADYKEIHSVAETSGCAKKCVTNTDCPDASTCTTDSKICKCNDTFVLNSDICFPSSASCKCQNGGECVKDGSDYKCKCLEGFAGAECEVRCDSVCGPNAKCEGVANNIKCSCESSYVNVSTTISINCLSDICTKEAPCKNNGKCEMLASGDYSCECTSKAIVGKDCSIKCEDSCGENAKCFHDSTTKTTYCDCLEGFYNIAKYPETKTNCVKNLCTKDTCLNNGRCEMKTEKNTTCKCHTGYSGEKCECKPDVCNNKCQGTNVKCFSDCNNYVCKCTNSSQIWNEQNRRCDDVDFCEYVSCGNLQDCYAGKCRCKKGHKTISDGKCEENFNICQELTNPCPEDHKICENSEPNFECVCKKGYYLDETSKQCKSFKCEDICPFGQPCNDKHECDCPTGFKRTSDRKCEPENLCTDAKNCGANSICFVHEGTEHCNICNSGYKKNANGICEDINECGNPEIRKTCEPFGQCINIPGSYKCDCGHNYYDEDKKICLLIDECNNNKIKHNCDLQTTTCENIDEGFKCNCIPNYEPLSSNSTHCKPEDKCSPSRCGPTATCQNNVYNPDGFECICPMGEIYTHRSGCVKAKQAYPGRIELQGDFDSILENSSSPLYVKMKTEIEIALMETLTTPDGDVVVKVVNFKNGSILVDYNLLSLMTLTSQSVANIWRQKCIDIPDDKQTCLLGGVLKKVKVKKDYLSTHESDVVESKCINEVNQVCAAGGYICSPNPNSDTSFACNCKPGFEEKYFSGDIAICSDIDECKMPNRCTELQVCHNEPGSYHCDCKPGYFKKDDTCKETCADNPCVKGECVKVHPNKWRCDCHIGFSGEKCDKEHSQYKVAFLGWEIAVGILAAVFTICLIVSCMIIRKLKRKLKNNDMYGAESQMNDYSQSTNNFAPTKNGRRDYERPAEP